MSARSALSEIADGPAALAQVCAESGALLERAPDLVALFCTAEHASAARELVKAPGELAPNAAIVDACAAEGVIGAAKQTKPRAARGDTACRSSRHALPWAELVRTAGPSVVRTVFGADSTTGAVAIDDVPRMGQTVRLHVRDAETASRELEALLAVQSTAPRSAALDFSCNRRGRNRLVGTHRDACVVARILKVGTVAGFDRGHHCNANGYLLGVTN